MNFQRDIVAADEFAIQNFPGVIYQVLHHAATDSANYAIEKMQEAMMFSNREHLRKYCCNLIKKKKKSVVVEFGVWSGNSINYFARELPRASVFGFDSFLGLNEDWSGWNLSKGMFNLNGISPLVEKNVIIYNGLYEDTIPEFVKNNNFENGIDLIHMDSDTYIPTIYALNTLNNLVRKGSIIIFDEYFGYPNWRNHEYKAFREFVLQNSINYRYIAYSEHAVAVEILKAG
jgi:predicted O-methyltransferase YrrM